MTKELFSKIKTCSTEELKRLIHVDTNLNTILDDQGCTLIHRAIEAGNIQAAIMLISEFEVDINSVSGEFAWTPLYIACAKYVDNVSSRNAEFLEFIDFLLINKANPNISSGGAYPLVLAASKCDIGLMTRLLNSGANVDVVDTGNITALIAAASSNYANTSKHAAIQLLVDCGADVNIRDNDHKSAEEYYKMDDLSLTIPGPSRTFIGENIDPDEEA